jgi:hypothetical protein
MKQKICILLSLNLLLSTLLPMFNYIGNAETNSSFEHNIELTNQEIEEVLKNLNFIETSELKTIFSIIEDDGILYEYESLVLNENTRDEKIAVSKYLIENGVRTKTVEYSEEEVYDNKPNNMFRLKRATCHGKTSGEITWAGTRASLYLDSCITKKITDIIDVASGATAAIAGIGAIIRRTHQLAKFVPYASAIAGILWFAGAGFKAISGNGQYGIGYHMARNPLTGNIYELVGVPWRQ